MLTSKGVTAKTLLRVDIIRGELGMCLPISTDIKDFAYDTERQSMLDHIDERIRLDKKPSATYTKVLEQIAAEREYLSELYGKLFETYQRAIDVTPRTRTSAKDAATIAMLSQMPDKMLREFTAMQLGDSANEFILPGERDQLIAAYVAIGKNGAE